ncbi:ABC1 kinase family protein [Gemmatimonas sp.]|jgi:predicted unusual protein kinase regulating ubiquinone biosynthesis (AarF/ABC1/UbiB family)|uniref:ABC1 kinase family protein n=1 Tax=Gemmatimonas sp. TaxID=1962908 RepID=UPI003919AA71
MPVRDLTRLWTILRRLTPLVLSFIRDRRRWLWFGAPLQRSPAFHERRAHAIVHQVATLGPTFVKLAQIFASRADLIPEPYLHALGTLTDRVPPVPWPTLRAALADAWQADPDTIVTALDPEPMAAGSLGQVHRARYEGRDVVVKVLRPGVEAIVDRDVRLSRKIVNAVYARWTHVHVLGFRVVLDEFDRHVREEMDFEREAMQCLRMRERFADEPRLRIPTVETALTRRTVLVLEFLEGTRIDRLDEQLARGVVRAETLTETLIETYARMMLRDGVFHADPHPGNLLVDRRGRLVLLDFGMVIDVPVATRKALLDTILSAIRRDAEGTVRGMYALGMVAPGTPPDTMRALVATLLDIAYSDTATIERARVVADRVLQELFNWPIILPGELVYFARTAALIEGVGARYDRHFNSIRVASPIMLRLRKELLAALLGDSGKREPLVTWAATLGALAGTAYTMVQRWWPGERPKEAAQVN